jgi:putative membrane protein
MQRASDSFDEAQRKRVDDAVAEAESKTAAEIVPVVATASGRYDRAEDIVGLWLGLIALTVTWWLYPASEDEVGSWSGMPAVLEIISLLAATVIGFFAGATLGSYVFPLRRLFTPRRQMQDEVEGRARQVFFDSSVHHTAGGTGLLIYVSLFEHLAVVLGDRIVVESLGQEEIDRLCEQLTEALRSGDLTEALCSTTRTAGEKLAEKLPRADDDVNELPDSLVTLD